MTAAYESHPFATEEVNPGVQDRLAGMAEIGGKVTLAQMMKACKSCADNGNDPFTNGTVEAGLFLSDEEFTKLWAYAKSLTITYPTRRKGKG